MDEVGLARELPGLRRIVFLLGKFGGSFDYSHTDRLSRGDYLDQ
jgi:hypothetical protein